MLEMMPLLRDVFQPYDLAGEGEIQKIFREAVESGRSLAM